MGSRLHQTRWLLLPSWITRKRLYSNFHFPRTSSKDVLILILKKSRLSQIWRVSEPDGKAYCLLMLMACLPWQYYSRSISGHSQALQLVEKLGWYWWFVEKCERNHGLVCTKPSEKQMRSWSWKGLKLKKADCVTGQLYSSCGSRKLERSGHDYCWRFWLEHGPIQSTDGRVVYSGW